MSLKPLHPFPARMAPDIALAGLCKLPPKSVVLDPMVGSGTVVRQATDLGHKAYGFDLDPLAVLMTRVWTRPVIAADVEALAQMVIAEGRSLRLGDIRLPWIDKDGETLAFTKFWFARKQRNDLRRLAFVLHRLDGELSTASSRAAADVLRLALSRIIVTKDRGASLARDVSHSRPHKVMEESDYDVMVGFERAVAQILRLQATHPPKKSASIRQGDARHMPSVKTSSIDAIFTSPPYLNAIDYMRGHRMSLVWLGHSITRLRSIRSESIGTERGMPAGTLDGHVEQIKRSMGRFDLLPPRHSAMVAKYANDVHGLLLEVARVLKPGGNAVFVVGNSNLKGTFINNAKGVATAALLAGMKLQLETERELPMNSRYLPMPTANHEPLGNRMRTETVMTFVA